MFWLLSHKKDESAIGNPLLHNLIALTSVSNIIAAQVGAIELFFFIC